jgi:hypothetical protein
MARRFAPLGSRPFVGTLLGCALGGLGLATLGCGGVSQPRVAAKGAPAEAKPAHVAAPSVDPEPLGPAHAFPPTERGDIGMEAWEPDGSRRVIAQGVRLIEHPGGAVDAADQLLPTSRTLAPTRLPARLGGGWVFGVNAGSEGLLWRAVTWTSALTPLARLDGEIERLVPGFDRLYVLRARGAPWIALDVDTGRALDLGTLPPSPSYGPMLFFDEWVGVVGVPLRGMLATFDAGGAWHPLGLSTASLASDDAGVRLEVEGRRYLLGTGGSLAPLPDPASSTAADAARRGGPGGRRLRAPEPLGPRPLEAALLHGFPASDGTALVATRGVLARVRLRDGAVVEQRPDAYGGRAPCDAVRLGAGAGFVCGEPHGATTIYALADGLSLLPVWSFDEPRRVAENGRGALVVDGGCAPHGAGRKVRCVIPRSGAPFEHPVHSQDERAVALDDGGLALLEPVTARAVAGERASKRGAEPPSSKKPAEEPLGSLTLVKPGASEQKLVLRLSEVDDDAARALVASGLWLDSFEQAPGGELRGWVAGASSFAGVRVKLDGRVSVGPPEPHLERALLSGRFALVIGRARGLRETVDGGFEWTDGELPAEPDLRLERTYGDEHGCSALGCAVGGWLRVGWSMGERSRLALAEPPEPTRLLASGSNRWSLECQPTGEQSRPVLRQSPQPEDRSVSPWNPLAEVAPPARSRSDTGYEVLNEAELELFHAYVWGPPGDGWARDARFLLRARDPFRVADSIWSTAPSPSPWSSAVIAADAFGRSANGPPATWRLVTDPIKHAGVLLTSTKGVLELYAVQEGRPITRLRTTGPIGVVTSVALAGGRLFVSALGESRSFRLFRVEAGVLELVGDFPDIGSHAEAPTLAPATRGEGVGVWLHEADYFLYPFDPATRRFDPPFVTRARELAQMPRSCTTGEDGYAVGDALSLEPNVDLQGKSDGATTGNGIEVRLIVGPSQVCVEGLAAPLGSSPGERENPRGGAGLRPPGPRAPGVGARLPSRVPTGEPPPHGVSERDSDPGVELAVDAPDGSRRGFRCRD